MTRDRFAEVIAPGRRLLGFAAAAQVVATAALVAQWVALAALVSRVMTPHAAVSFPLGLIAFGCAALIAAAAHGAARAWSRAAAAAVESALSARLLSGVLVAPSSSAGASVLLDRVREVSGYVQSAIPTRWSAAPAMAVVWVAIAVAYWPLALVLALCTALMAVNLRLAGISALDEARARLRDLDRLSAVLLESVNGMRQLIALRATAARRQTIAAASERLATATERVLRRAFVSGLIMDFAVTFAIAVAATLVGLELLGYATVVGAPALDLGTALLVLLLCPVYFVPLQRAAAGFHDRDRADSAMELISAVLDVPPPAPASETAAAVVSLADVTVHRGDRAVLNRVSLSLEPGTWTAISGPTGAGKTTLLDVVAGALVPDSGTSEAAAHSWLGSRTVILDGTVASNIALGAGTRASDAAPSATEIANAAAAAGLTDFLAAHPEGLDTRLGDGGTGVSAGEARRIAIARLVLAQRPVWLLDEPTAHLDGDTEAVVIAALRVASRGRIVLAATHSPAVAAAADQHFELRAGTLEAVRVKRDSGASGGAVAAQR